MPTGIRTNMSFVVVCIEQKETENEFGMAGPTVKSALRTRNKFEIKFLTVIKYTYKTQT